MAKIALVVLATLLGLKFKFKRSPVLSGILLVAISGTLIVKSEHSLTTGSLPPWVWVLLAVGFFTGVRFPCCRVSSHEHWLLRIPAMLVMLLHCTFDGHVIREVSGFWLTMQMTGHKFLDGVDNVLITQGYARWFQITAQIAVLLATPLGFLLVPPGAVTPWLHLATFAFVVSFNLGSAYHSFKHAWEERSAPVRSVEV